MFFYFSNYLNRVQVSGLSYHRQVAPSLLSVIRCKIVTKVICVIEALANKKKA